MDIAGEGDRVIVTSEGRVHVVGLVCSGVAGLFHSGLGGSSSEGGRGGGFSGNGCFPISSGGVALGKMTGGLVAFLTTGFRSKDMGPGVGVEG